MAVARHTGIILRSNGGTQDIVISNGDFAVTASSSFAGGELELGGGGTFNPGEITIRLQHEIETLVTDIIFRLLASPGEVPGAPSVGANLFGMVGAPMDKKTLAEISNKVTLALSYDGLISQEHIQVKTVPSNSSGAVMVTVEIVDTGTISGFSIPPITFDIDFRSNVRKVIDNVKRITF